MVGQRARNLAKGSADSDRVLVPLGLSGTLNMTTTATTAVPYEASVCTLSGTLTVNRIEQILMAWRSATDDGESLLLDLRTTQFIEPVALLYLFATIVDRATTDKGTLLRLPERKRLRDFLRAWNFQGAVQAGTHFPLRQLVHPDDHHYFGETASYYTAGRDPDLIRYLASRRFFGLMTHDLSAGGGRILEREWSRWRSPLILQVLERHLRGPGRDVARVVIYELLANAIQHPGARSATVVSSVYGAVTEKGWQDTSFTVSVWDDGNGIVDTLRTALKAGGSVRATTGAPVDRFDVKPVGWNPTCLSYSSDWTPDRESSDAELLLASVFPGISQKPWRRDIPILTRPDGESRSEDVGHGLHALYRSVVDDFGGSVAFRTGRHFLNLKGGESPRSYRAKLARYVDWPLFRGNMVTVRVPIAHQD